MTENPRLTRRMALFGFTGALALAGCGLVLGETYRYRMTVVIETPAGVRSGSSVVEVSAHSGGFLSSTSYVRRATGEAVFIDLPGGITVFALLTSPGDGYDAAAVYAERAYASAVPPGNDWRAEIQLLKKQSRPAELPPAAYPRLIVFREPGDARTVEVLDSSNLAASLGPGVRLRRIEIAITDDPVTSGISNRLPDLGPSGGYRQWANKLRYGDPRFLTLNDFKRED